MSGKSGFTLVELSIVLVVIGLLVGGILAAKSMIDTARTQGIIRQIQQVDIAVSNFKTNYKTVPGDSPNFTLEGDFSVNQASSYGPSYLHGDNNGYVNYATAGTPADWCSNTGLGCNHFVGEIANFYLQLSSTGLYPGHFVADIPAGGFNSDLKNLNAPNIKGSGLVFQLMPEPCNRPDLKNCYQATNYNGLPPGSYLGSASLVITPQVIQAIDVKMDDGKPLQGVVRNAAGDQYPYQGSNECNNYWSNGNDDVAAKYVYTSPFCNLSYGMLTQAINSD